MVSLPSLPKMVSLASPPNQVVFILAINQIRGRVAPDAVVAADGNDRAREAEPLSP
jgi:hypothetical protein